jgi:hypothetical protein
MIVLMFVRWGSYKAAAAVYPIRESGRAAARPESGIKAAAQPGIRNQARCAGRNQESGPLRGPESGIKNHRGGPRRLPTLS